MSERMTVKRLDPIHVLTVRRRLADQSEVVRALAALSPQVRDVVSGPPMALALGRPRDGKTDFDLAFPTARPIARDGFAARTFPALPVFSITHTGVLKGGAEGTNLADRGRSSSSSSSTSRSSSETTRSGSSTTTVWIRSVPKTNVS